LQTKMDLLWGILTVIPDLESDRDFTWQFLCDMIDSDIPDDEFTQVLDHLYPKRL
jgi:hypothetical protein